MKAGIVEADCLSIEGEVDEGRLTAIQLSHNSLAQIHEGMTMQQRTGDRGKGGRWSGHDLG